MTDHVADSEVLYRRVEFDERCFTTDESGNLLVTSTAFNDRNNQPSVDRAKLCNENPLHTQGHDIRTGVVSLISLEVRGIGLRKEGDNPITYYVDVVADPIGPEHLTLPVNLAHAEIRTDPTISSDNVFKRLRRSLAVLANRRGWLITPEGYR